MTISVAIAPAAIAGLVVRMAPSPSTYRRMSHDFMVIDRHRQLADAAHRHASESD